MVRSVAVSGATGGIGQAVTEALIHSGYRVFAIGRSTGKLDELRSRFPDVVPIVMDLVKSPVDSGELSDIARLEGLVHCAGISEIRSVEETSDDLWDETLAVNVTGPAALTRMLLPALRAARGRVVFVNAAPGSNAVPNWSAYTGSKAALRELADSLREEEDPNGVRVTTIYPAGVGTELLRKVREQLGRPYDPALTVRPQTLASVVVNALEFPEDAHLTEISLRAAPSGARD